MPHRTRHDAQGRARHLPEPASALGRRRCGGRAHGGEKLRCSSPRRGWVAEHGGVEGGPRFRASAGSRNCGRPTPGRVSCWAIGRCLSEAVQLGAWSSLPLDFHSATSRAYHATQREAGLQMAEDASSVEDTAPAKNMLISCRRRTEGNSTAALDNDRFDNPGVCL